MIPLIHQTDLFRPHEDPDDHWDLATAYALANKGWCSLEAVIIDYLPDHHRGSPDALAVAQMNYVNGVAVPFATGSPTRFSARNGTTESNGAVRLILDVLATANEPVVINIAGSARDIAYAVAQAPDLFAKKCRGIYLNAGTGETPGAPEMELEYNVRLDEAAFRALFQVKCPLYWAPCFEKLGVEWTIAKHGTWWKFQQSEIMDHLSPRLQNYFLSMFERKEDSDWLEHLIRPVQPDVYANFARQYRNMWCTAALLHAAGRTVDRTGKIGDRSAAADSVFSFTPIRSTCDSDFVTSWSPAPDATDRYIFNNTDLEHYQSAMQAALLALLNDMD